jgi:hypothetical protein
MGNDEVARLIQLLIRKSVIHAGFQAVRQFGAYQ